MIEKKIDDWTGELLYCKCTVCELVTNVDIDVCPREDEHKTNIKYEKTRNLEIE